MARIVLTTFGSTGDLNPFIALGLALRERGHDVLFAVEANFEQRVAAQRFPVRLLTGDQARTLGPYSQQIFNSDRMLTALKLLLDRYILPTLPAKVGELREICQGADLLISVATQFAASIIAELLHIPENDVMCIAFAPFSRIFPLCAAVIYHGGIGTIAQCLRAGVPSLIVPGGMDQPFNTAQVEQRKAGWWIPRKRYTSERASPALHALLDTPTYREQACKIQSQIAQEDGVTAICESVEQILTNKGKPPQF